MPCERSSKLPSTRANFWFKKVQVIYQYLEQLSLYQEAEGLSLSLKRLSYETAILL